MGWSWWWATRRQVSEMAARLAAIEDKLGIHAAPIAGGSQPKPRLDCGHKDTGWASVRSAGGGSLTICQACYQERWK
jgi:hypothetical protein